MYGRRSPTTSAWETTGCAFSSFSRFCGATFLPPAVTMMSFLRSVITRKPSSSRWPTSPVCTKPSSSSTSARRLRIVEVACEDGVRPDQDLAVLGDEQLDAGERLADGAEPEVAPRPVDGRRGRHLGEAVALEDQDVDRMEELGDVARERRAACVRDAEPAAEPLLHLRVDEPVGEAVLQGEPARYGLPRLAERRDTSRPTPSDQSISLRRTPVSSSNFATTAAWIFS